MEDFSGTRKVTTHGLVDSPIRPRAETFSFDEFDFLIGNVILGLGLLSHMPSRPASELYGNDQFCKPAELVPI